MKKIINGKLYNTETATLIGQYRNGYSRRDFNHFEEKLYKKRTGEYFLHGAGGASSKYRERYGDLYGYGEKIIPMSVSEAMAWAEEHLSADEYIAILGDVNE